MQDHEFDEILRGKLDGHVSPVPEDMWARVTGEKRRRLPFWVWWMLALGGMLAAGGGSYWVLGKRADARQDAAAATAAKPGKGLDSATGAGNETPTEGGVPAASSIPAAGADERKETGPGGLTRASAADDKGQGGKDGQDEEGQTPQKTRFGDSRITINQISGNVDVNDQRATLPAARVLRPAKVSGDTAAQRRAPLSWKRERWAVDALGSPDWAPVMQSWGYSGGVRVTRRFTGKMSGTVGLEYSYVHGTVGWDSIGAANIGKMRSLDLPLLLGYEAHSSRFIATIQVGAVVSAYSWFTARDNFGASHYTINKMGLSLYAGLKLDLPVDRRFSLFAEPYYRYRLTDMPGPNGYLSYPWKVNVVGLSLGARYYFKTRK